MLITSFGLLVPCLAFAQQQERVDLNVIHKIKNRRNRARQVAVEEGDGGGGDGGTSKSSHHGNHVPPDRPLRPPFNQLPAVSRRRRGAVGQLKEWGLGNVHLEKVGHSRR